MTHDVADCIIIFRSVKYSANKRYSECLPRIPIFFIPTGILLGPHGESKAASEFTVI